ncbi:MAG: multiheme c-type cytochrome [Desulfosarcinaceae bacterium]|nr:multiheme c-type cytochrome [Desulfosarcinaceae bacterium]
MNRSICLLIIVLMGSCLPILCAAADQDAAAPAAISDATQECLDCHASFHPGIVAGWRNSRHAAITPAAAMKVTGEGRKVSATDVPESLRTVAVGCAECHLLRPEAHADTFDHNGYDVHVVVSPQDCATCHPQEAEQYDRNIMAHARKNLKENAVYNQLQRSILGQPEVADGRLSVTAEGAAARAEGCYYCHGTELKVTGSEVRDTDAGELEFPIIAGWPNQGVGRINLDGSRGSCAACHTRHQFSMAMARKPDTCGECHVGPDVPALKVYKASKHGNIYLSKHHEWDFDKVPWTIGDDFRAPTCATCHISLLVDSDENVVAERTHEMKNRLSWRIFGLIYAHPQPINPDTTIIRNSEGRPLPTDFDGGFAQKFLISTEEQANRRMEMTAICLKCHDSSWVDGHFKRYEETIHASNASVKAATDLMRSAWDQGIATGLDQDQNPFDEAIERIWSDGWLFYANTVRFASAMAGGGDYGVFADGRYQLSRSVIQLADRLALEKRLGPRRE